MLGKDMREYNFQKKDLQKHLYNSEHIFYEKI
jgi:hypothetical protein